MHRSIFILALCAVLAVKAGWLDDLAKTATDVGKATGDWAQGAAKDTLKAASNAGKVTGDWVESTGKDAIESVGNAGETVGGWLKDARRKLAGSEDFDNESITDNSVFSDE